MKARSRTLIAPLVAVAMAVLAGHAAAKPDKISQFGFTRAPSEVGQVTPGPDGRMWFGSSTGEAKSALYGPIHFQYEINNIAPNGAIAGFPVSHEIGAIVAGPGPSFHSQLVADPYLRSRHSAS